MENKETASSGNRLYWFYLVGFCLILALPLLNLPPWFSPPNWGKTVIFRIIFSVLLFGALWFLLVGKNNNFSQKITVIKKSLSFKLLLALLGIYFLATLFSQDIYFSFWGSPYRSGGFLNFAFYILFAILAYLVLLRPHWQKVWNFVFIIAALVSLIAICQQFELFSEILITKTIQPAATLGNPIFLAIYLMLLSPLALAMGIKAKKIKQKVFYFSCLVLFLFVISITITRAAYIGLMIGFLYFFFFYPTKAKRNIYLKAIIGTLLAFMISGMLWLNSLPELPQFIQNSYILKNISKKVFPLESVLQNFERRTSGWQVAWEAMKDKPTLGYGPENFSIGFDRHYDPSIPYITKLNPSGSTGWWDRAHNFVFDIGVTAGIPALIIYLSLFVVLFYQLQKLKRKCPEKAIICQGIQAAFIAYLTANLFSFDSFSSYIILFFLIGYCLHLTNDAKVVETAENNSPSLIK